MNLQMDSKWILSKTMDNAYFYPKEISSCNTRLREEECTESVP